ncbi:MAG: ATP-binding cassette domain-containing protein, partial [Ruminiclostridium sp.]|nr:ATP-binding cassette domain-containing protein [Ruminiclostridium sp.]
MGEITINASDGITFDIEKGELAIVLGPSGSGKTTVLNMLGGMDTIDEGSIIVDGKDIAKYGRKELITYWRYE